VDAHGLGNWRPCAASLGEALQDLLPAPLAVNSAVPAIIPNDLWEAAQAVHGTRQFGIGRPWHRPYLLSGLIECCYCGKHFQAKRLKRGRVPAYYLCGGYVASGVAFCDTPRIPTTYLEDAVLEGIQKRLALALDAEELRRGLHEQLGADGDAGGARPAR